MDEAKPIDLERLTMPFPREALKTRQGGGGKALTYIPTHSVIHRLNDATKNRWDFRLIRFELIGDTYVAIGELTIPGLGTRTGIGVQKVAERSGEDLVKGVASDALKKAATCFGVGLELYGPDVEDDDEPQRPPQQRPAPSQQQPPQPTPFPQNREGGPNLTAVHAAAKGKVEGDAHARASSLAQAVYGVPSMRELTQPQADALRKAFGECQAPQDGETVIALAERINAATAKAELDGIANDIRAAELGSDRRALLSAAFLRVRESVKQIEKMPPQGQLLGAAGAAGSDRWTS